MKSTFLDNYGICLILLGKKIVVEVSSEGILVVHDNIFTSIYLYILKVTKNTLKECYFKECVFKNFITSITRNTLSQNPREALKDQQRE